MSGTGAFDVLVVCTANVCRSPLAAGLLRRRLDDAFGPGARAVRIGSAGTRALLGHGVDPPIAALLAGAGAGPAAGDPAPTARQLDEALVEEADLVLTMAREHRRAVVSLVPAAQRRTFTLPELARIARALEASAPVRDPGRAPARAGAPDAALRRLLSAAPRMRGPSAAADPADDDVADPHRGPQEAYRRAGRRIGEAVDAVVTGLLAMR